MYVYGSLAFECYNPARSGRRRPRPDAPANGARDATRILVLLREAPVRGSARDQLPRARRSRALAKQDAVRLPFLRKRREAGRSRRLFRGRNRAGTPPELRARGPAGRRGLSAGAARGLPRLLSSATSSGLATTSTSGPGYAVLNGLPRGRLPTGADRDVEGRRRTLGAARSRPERFRPLIADAAAHYAGEREGELDRDEVAAFLAWATESA